MRIDMTRIDTEPGADGHNPFTPPTGFVGGSDEYVALLRQRYESIDLGQHMTCIARRQLQPATYNLVYSGPFAQDARRIVQTLIQQFDRQHVAA
jgi:hypothetical protein